MRVAGRSAEAEHRIVLLGLETGTAEQTRVFIGLEIREAHDHGFRIERGGDGTDTFRESFDKKVRRLSVSAREALDRGASLGRHHLLGRYERHRMHADMLADDELHAGQAYPIVGQQRGLEGQIWVSQIDHDGRVRPFELAGGDALDLERQLTRVDATDVSFRAADGGE